MKKLILAILAMAGWSLLGTAGWAGDCGGHGCGEGACGAPAAPCTKMACVYVDQPCIRYRPEWHEREVQVTVNKLTQHEVTEHQTVCVNIPVYSEQVKFRTVCVQVPREVCHNVTCTRMVEKCEVDPCTGCKKKVCCPETYVKQVKTVVMEKVQKQEAYTEKVCTYRQEQQTVEIKHMVCELVPTVETRKENYCTMVPYATTVRVPTCREVTAYPFTPTPCGCSYGGCGAGGCGH
jgi:hypothetical protein